MRKNMVLISILVAALGSGVAMAKGPAGSGSGGMGGSGMGSSGAGMGAGSMNQGQQAVSSQAKGQTANETALKEQERLRERQRLQQKDGSGSADNAPFRTRSEEQIRLQQNLQP
jgi:hypothetical protein